MPTTVWWNPAPLQAAIAAKTRASVVAAGAVARSRCPWGHVAASVYALPTSAGGTVGAGASDALLCEFGAGPHEIAPHGTSLKFTGGDGGFRSFPVPHPGFGGTPFLRSAAAAWPSIFGGGGLGGFGFV